MNSALAYLDTHRTRLDLRRHGARGKLSSMLVTPRFRASRHVIHLVFADGDSTPVLVVKIPRLEGTDETVLQEAANLHAVHSLRPGGFDSIPKLVACEPHRNRTMLIETALAGRPMGQATVRRHRQACCSQTLAWLVDLARADKTGPSDGDDWFERLIDRPLARFAATFPLSADETDLLDRTGDVLATLQGANLPLVVEHGDLSHPNLILRADGSLGVIDWELAEPRGLPCQDLFYFLNYAAFASTRGNGPTRAIKAFSQAFFGPDAWAKQYVEQYADRLQLAPEWLAPLFVACWARHVFVLSGRLSDSAEETGRLDHQTAEWMRADRHLAFWRYALEHLDDLHWNCRPPDAVKGS